MLEMTTNVNATSSYFNIPLRVLESLNPYTANSNLALVLDVLAHRSGVGRALRTLAYLEVDVSNNWRPFQLEATFSDEDGSLEIGWKDPLAVIYLAPVPRQLQLHFGIEISFPEDSSMDSIVEIVA